jgi:hypothetical protein
LPSIFPETAAGGLALRDGSGNPTNPPGVERAHVPAPWYVSNCPITALPSDCTARIEPRQFNAIVSELLSFAECLDPDGPWNCASLRNICDAFTVWANSHIAGVFIGPVPPTAPEPNQLWWENDSGSLYIRYDDGNTVQWVQISGTGWQKVMDGISIVGAGTTASPHSVGLVDCGTY